MNKYIKKKCYGQILFIYIFLGIIGCFSLLCLWRNGDVLKNLYQADIFKKLYTVTNLQKKG